LKKLRNRFEFEASIGWENRIPITNPELTNLFGKKHNFESNQFVMPYAQKAFVDRSVLAFAGFSMDWYPFLEASSYNEKVSFNSTSSPRFRLEFTQALPGILHSTVDFSKAAISYRHSLTLSPRTHLELFSKSAFFFECQKIRPNGCSSFIGKSDACFGRS